MLAQVIGVAALLGQPLAPPDPCEALRLLVRSGAGPNAMRPVIVDTPASCVPEIAALLGSRGEVRFSAAWALSYIAVADGQDALYRAIARRPHFRLKEAAAVGAAAVGRTRDLEFLCKMLDLRDTYDEWNAAEAAALSLGLLGWRGCNVPLAETAKATGTLTGGAARHALASQESPRPCRAEANGSPDVVLRAVLDCGVPSSDRAPAYFESVGRRVWVRTAGGWTSRAVAADEATKLPGMVLVPWVSKTGVRAIVQVIFSFGRLDAIGYDYLLVRDGEWWVVKAVRRTLIS